MNCSMVFKGMARSARAEVVLSVEKKEEWGEGDREMARKMLQVREEDYKRKVVDNC